MMSYLNGLSFKSFPEPGLEAGNDAERLVAGSLPMGSGRAQPEEAKWDPPLGCLPPAGGAKGVECIVSWVAAEVRKLGGSSPASGITPEEERGGDFNHHC